MYTVYTILQFTDINIYSVLKDKNIYNLRIPGTRT